MYGTQQVADTLFAPSVPYANLGLKPRQYDPQKAKALLEKAGWTLPAGKDIREKMVSRCTLNFRSSAPMR